VEEIEPEAEPLLRRPQFVFTEMADGRIVSFGHPTIAPPPAPGLVDEALRQLAALSKDAGVTEAKDAEVDWIG
jgi:hypothetical protein